MERPTGVTILAVLYFLGAAFAGLFGLLFFVGGSMLSGMARSGGPGTGLFAMGGAVVGGVFLIIAVLDLILGIGLIKLQNWARIVAIVFTAIGVLFGVFGLVGTLAHLVLFQLVIQFVILGLYVWILVYLFKPHVKEAFGASF
jgi:hypothetical protein